MKLFSAISAGVSAFRNSLGGGAVFDSASDNPQRSTTVFFPYDSTKEIRPADRREMVKKHRSLRNNLGFVRGVVNTTVELSIGWGLQPIPKSGNKPYDARSLAYWKRATRRKSWDVTGKHNQPAMQRLALRETCVDGEILNLKVLDQFGRQQRQLIKTEQIGAGYFRGEPIGWEDGVQYNSLRRPLNYFVLQNDLPGLPPNQQRGVPRSASDMLHIYERERSTQNRGLPWGYTGLNHGIDMIDISAFEKIAHKLNTAIIATMTTATGESPKGMEALLSAAKAASAAGTAAATPPTRKDTAKGTQFLNLHGSMIPLFKVGESMNFFNGRNSVNTVEFTAALAAWYAQGFGLPVEMVIGMAQGSSAVRGNTDLAGRFFERCQMMIIDDLCQPDWESVIGTGILAWAYPRDYPGVEPLEPPPGWTGWDVVEWRGPRNIQIDKMRDGKLAIELVRGGLMTRAEWWTLNGEDPTDMDAAVDDDVAEGLQRWLDRGLPEEYFWRRQFGSNFTAATSAADPNQDPAGDNPPR